MAFRPGSYPSPLSSPFSMPQQYQQQQQPQPSSQQHIHLLTNDKTPVSYQTKWTDIHPESRQLLLQIEERILEHRDESIRLDQCQRLYNTSALSEGFELDAARIYQELGGISTALGREKVSLKELTRVAKEMLRNAEVAVRSFMILRPRFPRLAAPALAISAAPGTNPSISVANQHAIPVSQAASFSMPMVDFYSGIPMKPSFFMQQTVARFEQLLQEYRQWIEELERLLLSEGDKENGTKNSELSLLQSLPTVMTNVHDFFIYVAAEVECLHQQVGSMRAAYMADQRRRGHENNPFLEADRREVAKQEAAAKRVHPTLHAVSTTQPSTQAAGLFTSSGAPSSSFFGASSAAQSTLSSQSSSSSQSLFGTSLLFSPAASSSTAPTASLFGTPSTPASSSSLFGTSGAASTPSLFGASSSLFGSTPAVGSSSSVFSSSAFTGGSAAASSLSSGGSFGVASTTPGGFFSSSSSLSGGLFGGGQPVGNPFGVQTQPFGSSNIASAGTSLFGIGAPQMATATKPKPRTSRRK